jgi:hypothetical protein
MRMFRKVALASQPVLRGIHKTSGSPSRSGAGPQ